MTTIDLGLPQLGGLDRVPTEDEVQRAKDFTSDQEVRWCPGTATRCRSAATT